MPVPRRTVEQSPVDQLAARLRKIESNQAAQRTAASLRNSSISGGEGQKVYDDAGRLRLSIDVSGSVTAYDANEQPIARYGRLVETDPDEYGVEVRVGETDWVRLGYQTTGWSQIQKPSGYDVAADQWTPRPHGHDAADLSGPIKADGPTTEAFNRVVGGVVGEWHAVYMHSNGTFGRGSSGEQYKRNIRDALTADPLAVLRIRARIFDRRAEEADDYTPPVAVDELGVVAQEVAQVIPQLVTYRDGKIDGVRHEIGWVTLIPVAQNHETRLTEQQQRIEALERAVRELGGTL